MLDVFRNMVQSKRPQVNKKLVVYYAIRELSGIIVMGAALFWSAGTIGWWSAWAALGVMLGWMIAMAILTIMIHPEMLLKRLGPQRGTKQWDISLLSLISIVQLVKYIVAGLDHRNHWTNNSAISAQLFALVLCILGYSLFVWAASSNRAFSQIVHIDSTGRQEVACKGPYKYLRHPGYLGAIAYEIAVPVLLSSLFALLIGIVTVSLFVVRTATEDSSLRKELEGYKEYSRQVQYRIIPKIW